jgi:uroporphyrin-III C-methyltransferase
MSSGVTRGKVYIVGGGPGDPGLLTLRAAKVLAHADVLLYDALVSDAVLGYAAPNSQRIFVGRRRGTQTLTQEEICALLIREARAVKTVVRLKGGDPFVFGRGGEEALALARAHVPFEIVPGISSALAVAAYAGIPLTHRGVSASFTVAAGYETGDKHDSRLDWAHLAQTRGTLVVLMALSRLAEIARDLVRGGMPACTPAAVIENGTLPAQRSVTGTLSSIAELAERSAIDSPAIVLVGKTAALARSISWFEEAQAVSRVS